MQLIKLGLIIGCGFLFIVVGSFAQTRQLVPYPENFRGWTHVKSAVVGPESQFFTKYGGIHHVYANPKALEGFRTGNYPDGSVIVFDLFDVTQDKGVTGEGSRKFIDVMHKDSKMFAKTGGWGFEEFWGGKPTERKLTEAQAIGCYNCHATQKDKGGVFSVMRD
jgi:hypothetical protein